MSNFERRLQVVQRRPDATSADAGATAARSTAAGWVSIGWQAAEHITHLSGVEPGTVMTLDVRGTADDGVLEITWDGDGVASIRQL